MYCCFFVFICLSTFPPMTCRRTSHMSHDVPVYLPGYAGTELHSMATEAHVCERLVWGGIIDNAATGIEPASDLQLQLHHRAKHLTRWRYLEQVTCNQEHQWSNRMRRTRCCDAPCMYTTAASLRLASTSVPRPSVDAENAIVCERRFLEGKRGRPPKASIDAACLTGLECRHVATSTFSISCALPPATAERWLSDARSHWRRAAQLVKWVTSSLAPERIWKWAEDTCQARSAGKNGRDPPLFWLYK